VLAGGKRQSRVANAGGGITGRFDDDFDAVARDRRFSIVGELSCCNACIIPANVRRAVRARSGDRSAMAATSSPGVVGTCDKNIEPNLPAPISTTRTGFPAATRAARS